MATKVTRWDLLEVEPGVKTNPKDARGEFVACQECFFFQRGLTKDEGFYPMAGVPNEKNGRCMRRPVASDVYDTGWSGNAFAFVRLNDWCGDYTPSNPFTAVDI